MNNTTDKYHSYDYSFSYSAIKDAIVEVLTRPVYSISQEDINQARQLLRALEIMRDLREQALDNENAAAEEKTRAAAQEPAPF